MSGNGEQLGVQDFFADINAARDNGSIILSGLAAPKLGQEFATHAAYDQLTDALSGGDDMTVSYLRDGMTAFEARYGAYIADEVPTVIYWPDQAQP